MSKKPSASRVDPVKPPDPQAVQRGFDLTSQYLHWAMLSVLQVLYPEYSSVTIVFDLENGNARSSFQKKKDKT